MTVPHHKEEESLVTRSYHRFLKAVKTPPSRTTWLVLIVVLLVAVLVGSWFFFTSNASASSSELWLKKFETPPTEDALHQFAQDHNHQGYVQVRFAQAEEARLQMQTSDQLKSTNAAQARKNLETACATFEKLVGESADNPALMQQALLGAAKANLTLGDLGKAKSFYQQLARDYGATALGRDAADRVKALDDPNSHAEIEALNAAPSK